MLLLMLLRVVLRCSLHEAAWPAALQAEPGLVAAVQDTKQHAMMSQCAAAAAAAAGSVKM
jgi:hypothetical protein